MDEVLAGLPGRGVGGVGVAVRKPLIPAAGGCVDEEEEVSENFHRLRNRERGLRRSLLCRLLVEVHIYAKIDVGSMQVECMAFSFTAGSITWKE